MSLQRIPVGWLGSRAARIATCVMVAGFGAPVFALGLGDPDVASSLGQPLQMTVPLVMDAGAELSQECVRLISGSQIGDSAPTLNAARIAVDAERRLLKIESLQPISEPTLRVVVELGCKERIRREFALLLDPPSMAAPVAGFGAAGSARAAGAESLLGLGMAQISAVLGQRLTIRVPVVGAQAGSLTAGCVRLADPISSEGAPALRQAEIRVLPQDSGALIDVTTTEPVTEPAVRLAVDVGCAEPLRREYAILLGLPALAASDAGATAPAPDPAPPAAKPAPRRVARPATVAAATPVAPVGGQKKPAAGRPGEVAAKDTKAVVHASDRLVLASAQDSPGPAASGEAAAAVPDSNAELLKRLDSMSKQIAELQTQLAASRQHEQELERRAQETREQWTWSMGALGGLLLGGALMMLWRQRRPSMQPTWEPVVDRAPQAGAPRTIVPQTRTTRRSRETSEIGGRATMPSAPTVPGAITEPSLQDDKHTQITVTELHDTVQVIKELYATVLERNTSSATGGATATGPQRPLDLDLKAPIAATAPVGSARVLGDRARAGAAPAAPDGHEQRGSDERFTELPTEVGLDLDLGPMSSMQVPPALDLSADWLARGSAAPAAAAAPAVWAARPEPAIAAEIAEEHLTQTPTEVAIDIDVGPTAGFSGTIAQTAARFTYPPKAEPERSGKAPATLAPIDLQLDLSQPEIKRSA